MGNSSSFDLTEPRKDMSNSFVDLNGVFRRLSDNTTNYDRINEKYEENKEINANEDIDKMKPIDITTEIQYETEIIATKIDTHDYKEEINKKYEFIKNDKEKKESKFAKKLFKRCLKYKLDKKQKESENKTEEIPKVQKDLKFNLEESIENNQSIDTCDINKAIKAEVNQEIK